MVIMFSVKTTTKKTCLFYQKSQHAPISLQKTCPYNIQIFFSRKKKKKKKKMKKLLEKEGDIFNILGSNIDCGYTFELPRRGSNNKYTSTSL